MNWMSLLRGSNTAGWHCLVHNAGKRDRDALDKVWVVKLWSRSYNVAQKWYESCLKTRWHQAIGQSIFQTRIASGILWNVNWLEIKSTTTLLASKQHIKNQFQKGLYCDTFYRKQDSVVKCPRPFPDSNLSTTKTFRTNVRRSRSLNSNLQRKGVFSTNKSEIWHSIN